MDGLADVFREGVAHPFPYREPVPTGHDRRLNDLRRLPVDRPRYGEADPADPVRPDARLVEERAEPAREPVQDHIGAVRDHQVTGAFGKDRAGEVEHGGAPVPRLQVGYQHHGMGRVELQPCGGASTGGGAAWAPRSQPASEELIEAVPDGRPGQSRRLLQLPARGGLAAADELQQVSRTRLVSCHSCCPRPVRPCREAACAAAPATSSLLIGCQPLSAPLVSPSVRRRSAAKNSSTTGMVRITDPAIRTVFDTSMPLASC